MFLINIILLSFVFRINVFLICKVLNNLWDQWWFFIIIGQLDCARVVTICVAVVAHIGEIIIFLWNIFLYFLFLRCFQCFLCCKLDTAAHECCCTSFCLQTVGISILRAKIRGAYKIDGSVCGDWCTTCCCPCNYRLFKENIFSNSK